MRITLQAAIAATLVLGGCTTGKDTPAQSSRAVGRVIGGERQTHALPRAIVYRMAGGASADCVPVETDGRGNITSYPAPTDVVGMEPVRLAGGWLLDRRGISANSAFTRYTYKEYGTLKSVPTLARLKSEIISGAHATDIHYLDMTPSQAAADTAAVNAIIRTF